MTSLKHYHLGCGESLQSRQRELQTLVVTKVTDPLKTKRKPGARTAPGKQH